MLLSDRLKILLIFASLSLFLFVFHIFACWFSIQEDGDVTLLMISPLLYFLPVIGSALYLPFLFVMLFFQKTREDSLTGIMVCILSLSTYFLQSFLGTLIREKGFFELSNRSEELIIAIEKYQQDKKRYPLTLDHLVPVYIFEVPKTKMGAYPDYQYFVGDMAESSFPSNPYVIVVPTPSGFISFDQFIYLPNQNYSEVLSKHSFTKIGKWVYNTD